MCAQRASAATLRWRRCPSTRSHRRRTRRCPRRVVIDRPNPESFTFSNRGRITTSGWRCPTTSSGTRRWCSTRRSAGTRPDSRAAPRASDVADLALRVGLAMLQSRRADALAWLARAWQSMVGEGVDRVGGGGGGGGGRREGLERVRPRSPPATGVRRRRRRARRAPLSAPPSPPSSPPSPPARAQARRRAAEPPARGLCADVPPAGRRVRGPLDAVETLSSGVATSAPCCSRRRRSCTSGSTCRAWSASTEAAAAHEIGHSRLPPPQPGGQRQPRGSGPDGALHLQVAARVDRGGEQPLAGGELDHVLDDDAQGACLASDDLDSLNYLYPSCDLVRAVGELLCVRSKRRSGFLRMLLALGVPVLLGLLLTQLVQMYAARREEALRPARPGPARGEARRPDGLARQLQPRAARVWRQPQAAARAAAKAAKAERLKKRKERAKAKAKRKRVGGVEGDGADDGRRGRGRGRGGGGGGGGGGQGGGERGRRRRRCSGGGARLPAQGAVAGEAARTPRAASVRASIGRGAKAIATVHGAAARPAPPSPSRQTRAEGLGGDGRGGDARRAAGAGRPVRAAPADELVRTGTARSASRWGGSRPRWARCTGAREAAGVAGGGGAGRQARLLGWLR